MGLLALASLAIGVAAPWVVKGTSSTGSPPIGGSAAIGDISEPGWLIEPGYPRLRQHQPDRAGPDPDRVGPRGAGLRYLVSRRRARRVRRGRPGYRSPAGARSRPRSVTRTWSGSSSSWSTGCDATRTIGDQRFPERLSMIRAEPRIFDPAWLYRPITGSFTRAAEKRPQHPGRAARALSAVPATRVRGATADRPPARVSVRMGEQLRWTRRGHVSRARERLGPPTAREP